MRENPDHRHHRSGDHPVRARLTRAILGVPLFLKILLANALIAALAGVTALAVAQWLTGGAITGTVLVVSAVFVVATLVLGGFLNAAVIRLALSPLSALAATAERIRDGEYRARVPHSPLADRATSRMIQVFNRMLDGIQGAHERQQELALRVLQAEERERARIAHELYSGTAQTLAGVLVRLRLASRAWNDGDPPGAGGAEAEFTEELRRELAQALDEIRAVARRLRPPELDELGVRPALEAHARTLTEGRDLVVHFRGAVPASSPSRDAALAVFRISQEAITNAVLHADASRVEVMFEQRDAELLAEVSDDGRGFDVRELFTGTAPNLGVTGMRERAVYVGGTFSIDSAPGAGTRVRTVVPWSATDADAATDAAEPDLPGVDGVIHEMGVA